MPRPKGSKNKPRDPEAPAGATPAAASSAAPAEAPTGRKRPMSAAHKAAYLFDAMARLDEAEAAEIAAASPDGIRERYRLKRNKALEGVPGQVVKLVFGMRKAAEPAEEEDEDEDEEEEEEEGASAVNGEAARA
jgi:hypothetical protein